MIDILLVDDQRILLEGLKKVFEPVPDIAVCATCALAELAEEACLRYRPDLVLMDICMESRTSGIRICRRLKERFPEIRVVMMAGEHVFPVIRGRDTFGAAEANLTERELEILQLICRSKSREEIAELLGISKRTVGFHITNMLEKTGHKSVVGLAVEAAEKGLTSAETQNECERDDTVIS